MSLGFPKSKRIWVYGEWFGERFGDNSSYAFLQESIERKDIRKIWISKDWQIVEYVKKIGYESYHAYSVKGLFVQARAGVYFCSVNSRDFCFSSLTPRAIIFQLWHGIPLKKIGLDIEKASFKSRLFSFIRRMTTDKYSYLLSPSKSYDDFFCSAFGVKQNKLLRCGYPRCDGLVYNSKIKDCLSQNLGGRKYKYVIFYLPTHRHEGKKPDKINYLVQQILGLQVLLEKFDCLLVVKPHYYEKNNVSEITHGNIVVTHSLPYDLYVSLSGADALISDYSSVILDVASVEKPVFSYIPDVRSYEQEERGGYYRYEDILPNACYNTHQLERSLLRFFSGEPVLQEIKVDIKMLSEGTSFSKDLQKIAEELVLG